MRLENLGHKTARSIRLIKDWGGAWLIAVKHNYQTVRIKLMYDCSGAKAREVLAHLSL